MKYRTASGFVVREFLEEFLLIPVHLNEAPQMQTAILNAVGQFLWEQLQTEKTEDELLEAVCEAFEVPEEIALTDIREFLKELEKYHCLVKIPCA